MDDKYDRMKVRGVGAPVLRAAAAARGQQQVLLLCLLPGGYPKRGPGCCCSLEAAFVVPKNLVGADVLR